MLELAPPKKQTETAALEVRRKKATKYQIFGLVAEW